MAKPAKAETKPQDDVEIIPDEKQVSNPVEIEVDAATGKPVEVPPVQQNLSAEEFRKLEARLEYQRRQDKKELMDALSKIQPQTPAIAQPREVDKPEDFDPDLHAIAQTNYQKAFKIQAQREAKKVAEETFKSLMEARDSEQRKRTAEESKACALEMSRKRVLDRAPDLADENSELFKNYYSVYSQMTQEDPDLLSNPRGPEIVYAEMKERAVTKPVDQESERIKRVMGSASPVSRPIQSGKTIRLTQDELDMCKEKGLSPAVFAEMKNANFKEGVTA